eukprot:SAG11_NODE_2719_length_3048_cov_3.886402_1_plen_770_part_00
MSAAYLSLSSSCLSPWDVPPALSKEMAQSLGIRPSTIRFPHSQTLPVFSPRIPSILFPLVQGARLLLPVFRQRWREFAAILRSRAISAVEAVQMARRGWVPEFSRPPIQFAPPPEPVWSSVAIERMDEIHSELLSTQIVEEVPPPVYADPQVILAATASMCYFGGAPFLVPSVVLPFVHVMFAVPKPHSDKWRGVSALSRFNEWVVPRHFKMEGLHSVRQLLSPLDFMTVIDLKAAYPTMGIHPRYRDLFIFRFRGKFYRYRGCVFGVSSLPRAWTKLLRPVMAFFRSFGLKIVVFLDDLLIMSSSYIQCATDTQDVLTVLTYLGFIISTKEQVKLVPSQRQIWCGAEICSITMMFYLPRDKERKLQRLVRRTIKTVNAGILLTRRQWAQVLGTLRATMFAVLPALLWSQAVRRFVGRGLRTDKRCWEERLPQPPAEVMDNLSVWVSPRFKNFNGRPIRPLPAQVFTESDASSTLGGGMVMTHPEKLVSRWHWLPSELKNHINWGELVTHLRGLMALDLEVPGLLLNAFVRNKTDSKVAMSYVNRQGGRIELLSLAAEALWTWLLDRGMTIRSEFIAGVKNTLADDASRWWIDLQEWQALPRLFNELHRSKRWGPFTVDAFASRLNCQLPRFWTRYADPDSPEPADAFRKSWQTENLWLCPPHALIPRILQKLQEDRCQNATLLAPLWPSQPWWPLLLQLTQRAVVLGAFHNVFQHPRPRHQTSRPPHLRVPSWKVAAFKLCGNHSHSRDMTRQLSTDLLLHGKAQMHD